MKMVELCLLLSLLHLGLTVAGQEEAVQILHLHEPLFHVPSIGVPVNEADLPEISSSVLGAEIWLRKHVLAHFPSTNVSIIVVGRNFLCNRHHEHRWSVILPSVKNLFNSLTRWGLEKEIRVSAAFSSDCFDSLSFHHRSRGEKIKNTIKLLLQFIQDNRLPYILDPPTLFSNHRKALVNFGFSGIKDIRVLKIANTNTRKLYSKPSSQFAPVPDSSFSFAPDSPPDEIPGNPPESDAAPPTLCLPATAPTPGKAEDRSGGLWCVAKPTVPAEKLQEGMDYACGEGGTVCDEIMPDGKCYNPDNVVAHASFAFNSYWQKTKKTGGSCSFDGTAILINSDPSFLQCKFVFN